MIVSKQIMGTARGPVLAALSCCCGVQREASVCCRSAEDKQLMSLTERASSQKLPHQQVSHKSCRMSLNKAAEVHIP